jgi:Asp-tRNA(Asn)/Glu-tRNA(Gln) amidotransferase C subunit
MYRVVCKKQTDEYDDEVEEINAKFIREANDIIYFYNKVDTLDIDSPIAMYNKNEIKNIKKV